MNNKLLIYGVAALVIIGGIIALIAVNRSDNPEVASNTGEQSAMEQKDTMSSDAMEIKFGNAKKSAHY